MWIAVAMMVGMTAYELGKSLLEPELTAWQSQFLTVVVSALLAAAACAALRRRERPGSKALADRDEHKVTEAALLASEEALQRALEVGRLGTWEMEVESGAVRWSRTLEAIAGLAPFTFGATREAFMQCIHADDRDAVAAAFSRALASGEDLLVEHRMVKPNGAVRWVETRGRAVPAQAGSAPHMLGTAADVTDRRRAEEQLARLSRHNEMILGAIAEGVYEVDADGRATFVNAAAAEMLGWSAGELSGRLLHPLIHHSTADGSPYPEKTCPIFASLADGTVHASDSDVFWRRDGLPFPIEYTSTPVLEHGEVLGAVVSFRDISERKGTERSLRKQSIAIEASVDGIAILDDKLSFAFLNTAYARMYGYEDAEKLLGASWNAVYDAAERERLNACVQPALAERRYWHGEATATRRNGAPLEQSLSITRLPGGGFVCVVRDVSERNQAHDALRRSEERFRLASQLAIDLTYEWNLRTDELIWFGDVDGRLGYRPGELPRTFAVWEQIMHPDDRARVAAAVAHHLETGATYREEHRVINKDGACRYWMARGIALRGADGAPHKWIGVTTDITERKENEIVLLEAERRAIDDYERLLDRLAYLALAFGTARDMLAAYRALRAFALQSSPCNGIFISLYDADRGVRTAVYAWSEGEEVDVSGLPVMPMTESPHSRAVATGKVVVTDDYQGEVAGQAVVYLGLENSPRLPQSSLAAPMSMMGRVVGAVEVQSTEKAAFTEEHVTAIRMAANLAAIALENLRLAERASEREEQLRQSQKMEAVGQLAGGVAHDFNNLLTVINGYGEMLRRGLDAEHPLRAFVEEITTAGQRAAGLTRQLLAFSRRQVLQPKVLDLNTTVTEMEKMLRRLIGEDIELVLATDPTLGRVKADPGQLEQVIMNLAVNARDAMSGGGTIIIRTADLTDFDRASPAFAGLEAGPHVMLAVSDTGCGMSEETKAHVFEPFFTTKEQGKGTGLGLSTVYGIVTQSNGRIRVDSTPGQGTTFSIFLPRVDEVEEQPIAEPETVHDGLATETVLLVEDEDAVRQLARRLLLIQGYTVLEACDGESGLAVSRAHPHRIDVIVTDVVMPRMSGPELVERLAPLRPEAKVIYMSGYTDDAIAHHDVLANGAAFLEKPFRPNALTDKVREVLDAPAAADPPPLAAPPSNDAVVE